MWRPCEQRRVGKGGGGGGIWKIFSLAYEPCFGRKLVENIPRRPLIGPPLSFVNIR